MLCTDKPMTSLHYWITWIRGRYLRNIRFPTTWLGFEIQHIRFVRNLTSGFGGDSADLENTSENLPQLEPILVTEI